MPVFTSKTTTDPGPFNAVAAPETQEVTPSTATEATKASTPSEAPRQTAETSTGSRPTPAEVEPGGSHAGSSPAPDTHSTQQAPESAHLGEQATDDDEVLDRLYRFREIAVTAEMRRELLGAKLPLASPEQLADTQPPNRGELNASAHPPGAAINRNAPTEPSLSQASEVEQPARATPPELELTPATALDTVEPSYSTSAPTLLSVRRRRSRNRRLVGLFLAALGLALVAGAFVKLLNAPEAPGDAAANDRAPSQRHIAGNSPATPPSDRAKADEEPADGSSTDALRESPSEAEIAQPSAASPDTSLGTSATAGSAPASAAASAFPMVSTQSMTHPRRSKAVSSSGPSAAALPRGGAAVRSGLAKAPPRSAPAPVAQQPAASGPKREGAGVRPSPSTRKGFDPEELIF